MAQKTDFSDFVKNVVAGSFNIDGTCIKAAPYGNGHINDTYAAYYKMANGTEKRYLIQGINTDIFTNPEKLMDNIANVTAFLKTKITENGGDPLKETLTIVKTKENKNFYKDENGRYWRCYIFIEDAISYEIVEKPEDFYTVARAFGNFQTLLADYPADTLYESIPNFHNTPSRFNDFKAAVKEDIMGRAKDVQAEIQFFLDRESDTHVITDLMAAGELPTRVTHNDTKLNNILIDPKTGKGLCVIDLDTVMPGTALNDYGDSIRFGASTALEDETDLSKVSIDLNLFELFTKGFLETAGKVFNKAEIDNLPMAAKLMTLECGMRFLGDYLNGDTYFKITREHHNLDRARTQIKLVSDMESKWEQMKEIVKKISKENK